jgi:hypothetical protein
MLMPPRTAAPASLIELPAARGVALRRHHLVTALHCRLGDRQVPGHPQPPVEGLLDVVLQGHDDAHVVGNGLLHLVLVRPDISSLP